MVQPPPNVRSSSLSPQVPEGVGPRALVVDDEPAILQLARVILEQDGWSCVTAETAAEAVAALATESFALAVCDINLPDRTGLDIIRDELVMHPETAAIVMSARTDQRVIDEALALGAYGYVVKPFRAIELSISARNAVRQHTLVMERERERRALVESLADRAARAEETADRLASDLLDRLSRAIRMRDDETADHIERVSVFARTIGTRLGWDRGRVEAIGWASRLHDIGKIGVPDRILLKPAVLTPLEMELVRKHSRMGFELLRGWEQGSLHQAALVALTHHERWDGTGYPDGIADDAIPIEGRIAAIADVFDALTTDRVYRPAFPVDRALEIMSTERGRHFDPDLLDVFLGAIDDVLPHIGSKAGGRAIRLDDPSATLVREDAAREMLRNAVEAVMQAETPDECVELLASALRSMFPVSRIGVRIVEPDRLSMVLAALWSEGRTSMRAGLRMSVLATSFPEVLERGEPVFDADTPETLMFETLLRDEGMRSLVSLPLHVGDRIVGVLSFGSRLVNAFPHESRAFFASLGAAVEERIVQMTMTPR